jgi:hypothetical protein
MDERVPVLSFSEMLFPLKIYRFYGNVFRKLAKKRERIVGQDDFDDTCC